ncbi:TniB family NTP-binding protein [Aliihoeflea sp. 2WW]|uniref:TniB family NTP-binding protein n=1 Tax=Aliihoeflea sp. 2WW TaxID=1381123 RepID=UPI0004657935|nr:TniB family NTP-binding protein [Aliihoeflea sp. 2WW]
MQTTKVEGARDIETIARDIFKAYLGSERDKDLADAMYRLTENSARAADAVGEACVGRLSEGRMLALLGASGAGKTRALERIFARTVEFGDWQDIDADSPLISIKAPSPCTLKQLGIEVLRALGYPIRRDLKEYVVWELVRERLQLRKVRYVHIDELQHVAKKGYVKEAQKVRDTIKSLVQWPQWPVSVIVSGTPEIATFIEEDTQIKRRCLIVNFTSLDVDADAAQFAQRLTALVKRKAELSLGADAITLSRKVIHAAERQYGTAIEIVQDATLEALREGTGTVDNGHFARIFKIRTGCSEDRNVFTAADWRDIDVGSSLQLALSDQGRGAERKPNRVRRNG